jgi:hypothetical protein
MKHAGRRWRIVLLPKDSQNELRRNPVRRSSVAFIRYSSRVPKTTVFDATPGEESLRQGDGLPSVTSTGYSWKPRLRGEVAQEVRTLLVIVVIIVVIVVAYLLLSRRRR